MDLAANQPAVMFVDDEPGRLFGLRELLSQRGVLSDAAHPLDLEPDQLLGVHLVSVDEFLGDDWAAWLASPDGPRSPAAAPADGLAVAAAIGSRFSANVAGPAMSLHTGKLDVLGAGLPEAQREPLLAAGHDLDWVFRWDDTPKADVANLADRMVSLASAVASLPPDWPTSAEDFGTGWLSLDERQEWYDLALQQVEDCRPPAHGVARNTRGRALVRWLAQRVLPYPAFLLDAAHAAVMLGIKYIEFDEVTGTSSDLAMALEQCRYAGPLANFSGDRWWRAGLGALLEAADTSDVDLPADRAQALTTKFGVEVAPVDVDRPVVAYDSQGHQARDVVDAREAVRTHPDGWPVFADDPWALREDAAHDEDLRALVMHLDRHRLG